MVKCLSSSYEEATKESNFLEQTGPMERDNADSFDESYSSAESQSIDRKTVELTPGEFVPLRGAEEAIQALDKGEVLTFNCVFCEACLVVHIAATMVLCPYCEMISPLEGDKSKVIISRSLGLGLRETSLCEELDMLKNLEE